MLRFARLLVGAAAFVLPATAAAEPPLVYWQPSAGGAAAAVRAAVERNQRARGGRFVDASETSPPPTPLAPALEAAIAEYRAFHFAAAERALAALVESARASGGGDLTARQLSELYLYLGLSRTELNRPDEAWDDFVRAAQLDPTRVLDEAQFPPKVVAAYRRAATDAAALPRANVTLTLPGDAALHVDGRPVTSPVALTLGAHFVRVEAPGFAPWAGTVEVTATEQHVELPLAPVRAPPASELAAAAGTGRVLVSTLARSGRRWQLALADVNGPAGTRALEAPVDADSAERVVDDLLHRLLDATSPPARPHRRVPWWGWALGGGVVAALAVVIPVAVVYSQPTPTVGGPIGPLH